jgi:hypothetical protein
LSIGHEPDVAYTADKVARFVYHEKSTDLSPARNHISSANRANSPIELEIFSGKAITANAYRQPPQSVMDVPPAIAQ